ncbi:MAG: hypothetical protein QNL92_05155 [Octadecabacter sp.]
MSQSNGSGNGPNLIQMYIKHCIIGFIASAIFVGMLFAFDVGGLWRLVSGSPIGIVAALMLWVFNGVVFAGVQFGIAIMNMGEDDDDDNDKGHRDRIGLHIPNHAPIPVRVDRH